MRRKLVLRTSALVALLSLLLVALVGCGSGGTQEAGEGAGGTDQAEGQEFELFVASGADPVDLDPRKTWVGPGYSINSHLFEPLVFRRQTADGMELYPVLAESWELIDDVTWEFKIREGVQFHNGETLDAEAVAYTFNTIMDPEFVTNIKTWTSDIERVEAVDATTLRIITKYPARGLLSSLSQVPIVAPGAAEELGAEFTQKPVGTGPYKFVSYTPNSEVVVERFDGYWGEPGKARRITFRIMPENATRIAALQSGEVHLAESLPPDKVNQIKSNAELDVVSTPTLRVDFLVLDFRNPWIQKKEFRQALSLAIDRATLVETILGGTTVPANSISPPGTIGYDKSLPVFPYDLAQAKELLAASGYNGEPLQMGAPVGRYLMDRQINEAVAGMFRELGLNVELEVQPWSNYIAKANEGQYDIFFLGQTDLNLNPTTHWSTVYYSPTARGHYNNPTVDQLIEESASEMDDERVVAIFQEVQRIAYDDLASLPLYYEPQIIGISKRLRGFAPRLDEYVIVSGAELAQ